MARQARKTCSKNSMGLAHLSYTSPALLAGHVLCLKQLPEMRLKLDSKVTATTRGFL